MTYPRLIQAFIEDIARLPTAVHPPLRDPDDLDTATVSELLGGIPEDEVGGPLWLVYDRCTFDADGRLVSRSVSARKQEQGARLVA